MFQAASFVLQGRVASCLCCGLSVLGHDLLLTGGHGVFVPAAAVSGYR